MRKSQLIISSLLLALICAFPYHTNAIHKKKKKQKQKSVKKAAIKALSSDTLLIMPAPGVRNKTSFDSLKSAKMKLKKLTNTSNLIVSFVSEGEGIDRKSLIDFENFIKKYKTVNSCHLEFKTHNWGREGELDYCITASDPACMKEFLLGVQKQFKGNSRVLIQENTFCKE